MAVPPSAPTAHPAQGRRGLRPENRPVVDRGTSAETCHRGAGLCLPASTVPPALPWVPVSCPFPLVSQKRVEG